MGGVSPDDPDAVRLAYDALADTYADHVRGTEPELDMDLATIRHFVALLPEPRHVLDAGCGAGRMLPVLAGLGCHVEGVDLSPGMIRRARADHPRFAVRVASLTCLPLADASVDGVFAWYSTVHSADAELPLIVAEARRVLRPGGIVLLAFQTGTGVRDVGGAYRRFGHDVVLPRHSRSVSQYADQLVDAGLTVVLRLARTPAPHESDGQGFLIGRCG